MLTDLDTKSGKARYWFDSLAELARHIETAPKTWNARHAKKNPPSKSWDLNAGYDSAWQMARDGWLEGAREAEKALKVFQPATPAPDTVTDFYGHRPHVPRYCAGAPDAMIRFAPMADSGAGKVLTIILPISANCGQDANAMRNYGVGLAQYVNQLETEGTRCEVICAMTLEYVGKLKRGSWAWRVKSADQMLDLAVLAFAVGHPAMFRRLGFALMECSALQEHFAYGYTRRSTASDVLNAPNGAVVLNGMTKANEYGRTPETALAAISKEIETALSAQEEQ